LEVSVGEYGHEVEALLVREIRRSLNILSAKKLVGEAVRKRNASNFLPFIFVELCFNSLPQTLRVVRK